MRSNSISKTEIIKDTYDTPKMGLIDTKTVDSAANVSNKIESNNILLMIMVLIMCTYILFRAYK